jgi:NADPH:quinone reductase-like Zn-dependent oxidoreductase
MPTGKAIVLREFGPQHLKWESIPQDNPGPHQVRLKMRAFSLNFRDLATINGKLPNIKLPLIPLSDGVGEVIECGPGVSRFKTGERVCPRFFPRWISGKAEAGIYAQSLGGAVDGVLSEFLTLHEDTASLVPDHLTDEQAATLPCAALTAWTALMCGAEPVKAGETVLLQGTGGVSVFGLQLANLMGARAIITSSDDAKLSRATALGANHVINYRTTPDWAAAVLEITQGRGVDRVLDVGGPATLGQSINALGQNGHIVLIGVLGGRQAEVVIPQLMMKHATLEAITVGHRAGFEAMCRAIALHRLVPVVDQAFGVDHIGDAMQAMASGGHFGKIALRL